MLLAVVELGVVKLGEGRIDHCRDGTQTAKYNLLLVQVQSRQVAASFSTNQVVGGTDEVGREGGDAIKTFVTIGKNSNDG